MGQSQDQITQFYEASFSESPTPMLLYASHGELIWHNTLGQDIVERFAMKQCMESLCREISWGGQRYYLLEWTPGLEFFEAMDDIVMLVDQAFVVRRLWGSKEKSLYHHPKDVINQRLDKLIPETLYQVLQKTHERALREGRVFSFDFLDPVQTEPLRWFRCRVSPLRHGSLTLLLISDVTQEVLLKNREDQHRRHIEEIKEQLGMVLNDSPSLSYVCTNDADWSAIFINSYVEVMLGYTPEEFFSKKIDMARIIHPDDFAWVSEKVAHAIEHNTLFEFEYRLVHKDGSIRWVSEKGRLSPNHQHLIGVIFDITEKKELESELERQRYALDQFFNLSVNFLSMSNLEGYFVKINKAWENFGYSVDELMSTHSMSYIHPDDLQSSWDVMKKLGEGQDAVHFQHRVRHGNGSYRVLDWTATYDPTTSLVYSLAQDVTDQIYEKKIEQIISRLREDYILTKERPKEFFDKLLDTYLEVTESAFGFIGQVHHDDKGVPYLKTLSMTDIAWNQYTRDLVAKAEVQGLVFENLESLFGHVMTNGEILVTNHPAEHPSAAGLPSGHPALNSFMGLPIKNGEEVLAVIALANAPQGYHQEELPRLSKLIEATGQMIQVYLMDQGLEKKRRMLAHRAKLASLGELSAGVGHEINNPLMIAHGYLDVLYDSLQKTSEIPQELYERPMQRVFIAMDRITNIVNGLRLFARSDTGQKTSFDLKEVLAQAHDLLSEIYQNDGIELTFQLPDHPVLIWGNSGQISQVVMNLLSNAKDALEQSEKKRIEVYLTTLEEQVRLEIRDNGQGILKEHREKLFDPFFTTKEVDKGTGIGLSISHGIITDHEGEISFTTEVGAGTSFLLTLPLRPEASLTASRVKQVQETTKHETRKVLLVEDDFELRELLRGIFEHLGHKAYTASHGADALELIDQSHTVFDLIFSDINMPFMTGPELIKEIRRRPQFAQTKFVLITGGVHHDFASDQELKSLGLDGHLYKPCKLEDIKNLMNDLFHHQGHVAPGK